MRLSHWTALALGVCMNVAHAQDSKSDPAKSACQLIQVAELPLAFYSSGGPSVSGTVEGKPVQFLVRTGDVKSYLLPDGVQYLGLSTRPWVNNHTGYGVAWTRISQLSVGAMKVVTKPFNMDVIDSEPGQGLVGHAALGADFLVQRDLEISYREGVMRLFTSHGCGKDVLAYWKGNLFAVPLEDDNDSLEGSRRVMLSVEVNGIKLRAMIDTGMPFSTISRAAAIKVGAVPASADGEQSRPKLNKLTVGAETVLNPQLVVVNGGDAHVDIRLGGDFLSSHRILIALRQRLIYMSHEGGPVFDTKGFGIPGVQYWSGPASAGLAPVPAKPAQ